MPDKIVMLTNGNIHGIDILQGLAKKGIKIDVVLENHPRISDNLSKSNSKPTLVNWLKALKRWYLRKRASKYALEKLSLMAKELHSTGPINSKRMKNSLRGLKPDYIILGGIGILHDSVIKIARKGVLNTHPGILPWARGSGVVGRSIQSGIACGGTCHYVNSGIDKGDFIQRRLLRLDGDEKSLGEIEHKAHLLVVEMMVDTVLGILETGNKPEHVVQVKKYKIYKTLSQSDRKVIDQMVIDEKAWSLFESWQDKSLGEPLYILPGKFQG
mgnify:CR=1 FL=1|tara:strand:+ start:21229 stop:22041 length:813 start_codon:yes stop_codon:yes gene_type:complete